ALAARAAGAHRGRAAARPGIRDRPAPRPRRGRRRAPVPRRAGRGSGGEPAPRREAARGLLRPGPPPAPGRRPLRPRRGAALVSPARAAAASREAWTLDEARDAAAVSARLRARGVALEPEEVTLLGELLGRSPRWAEAVLFGILWSEHCSYKSTRQLLKRLPT